MGNQSALRKGTLYLVGTPIGNLSDITLRAIETLKQVSGVAAEDTRRTRGLLSHLGIGGKPLHSVNANTPLSRQHRLLDLLEAGQDIALVTDAGMPTVSDPGLTLVRAAAERGLSVACIPGPSALTTAVALSGLVSGPFTFLGFLPRRGKKREQTLERIQRSPEPSVLFESPVRVPRTLAELAERMPERAAALCRELTKLHEEVSRDTLARLAESVSSVRGEVTLVIAGDPAYDTAELLEGPELDAAIVELLAEGGSTRDVVQNLGERSGLPRQALYARVQALRDADS